MANTDTENRSNLDTSTVVATAGAIADSEGLDAVTLTRVAKDLGISQPALYRHVDGYDDLLRRLSLEGRELLAESLQACLLYTSPSPRDRG